MYSSCSSIFLSARSSFFLYDNKKINEAAEILEHHGTFVRSRTEILNLSFQIGCLYHNQRLLGTEALR